MTAPPAYSQGGAFLYKDYDWDEFYDSHCDREYVDKSCDASEEFYGA